MSTIDDIFNQTRAVVQESSLGVQRMFSTPPQVSTESYKRCITMQRAYAVLAAYVDRVMPESHDKTRALDLLRDSMNVAMDAALQRDEYGRFLNDDVHGQRPGSEQSPPVAD